MANGFAPATSVDAEHSTTLGLAAIETFLAVSLTKPLDAFSIASTLRFSGSSVGYQNLIKLFSQLSYLLVPCFSISDFPRSPILHGGGG